MTEPSATATKAATEAFGHLPPDLVKLAATWMTIIEMIDDRYIDTREHSRAGLTAMQAAELTGRTAGAEWSRRQAWAQERSPRTRMLYDLECRYPRPLRTITVPPGIRVSNMIGQTTDKWEW